MVFYIKGGDYMQKNVANTQKETFGKSVESYFANLTNKAMEDKQKNSKKLAKHQMESFGAWFEAD